MANESVPMGPWDQNPGDWNVLELNDEEWPGFARVEIKRANKWDDKKAKGSHGGERELAGVDCAPVKITIHFWTSEQYERLKELMPTIEPIPGKKKLDAIKIGHAVASFRNVKSITIDEVSGPTYGAGELGTLHIEATEHRPPDTKKATGTAKGGGGGSKATSTNSRCAELKREMNEARRHASQVEKEISRARSDYYGPTGGGDELNKEKARDNFNNTMRSLEQERDGALQRTDAAARQMNSLNCPQNPPSENPKVTNP